MTRYERTNHSIYNVNYHIIWIPKYRRKILIGTLKIELIKALLEKADKLGIKIEKYEIMPYHIHLFIKCMPNINISKIIGELKGYSSYMVNKEKRRKIMGAKLLL